MDTTDINWSDLRDEYSDLYGETPGAQLEQDIIERALEDPERVINTLRRIATQHATNPLRSPWAVARADLKRQTQHDTSINLAAGKSRAVINAETWIANAGLHYDRWETAEAELFGDDISKGRLTTHDTPELRTHMYDYWLKHRPRGIQAEADFEAWNAKCKTDRQAALAQRKAQATADINFE